MLAPRGGGPLMGGILHVASGSPGSGVGGGIFGVEVDVFWDVVDGRLALLTDDGRIRRPRGVPDVDGEAPGGQIPVMSWGHGRIL